MSNEVINEVKKAPGERSVRFPSINLQFAIDVVKEARKFGKTITNNHLAGKGKPQGGGFVRKRAALGYYGLIDGRGEKIRITDLSESIIYSTSEEERKFALKKAFINPEIFNKLYKETEKNSVIDLEVLGNILVRQYGIAASSVKDFLSVFIKSGMLAGLIEYSSKDKRSILFLDESYLEQKTKVEAEIPIGSEVQKVNTKEVGLLEYHQYEIGGVILRIPKSSEVDTAILEGGLGEISKLIKAFAEKTGINKKESIDDAG